jgi:hypothetical protein
MMGSPGRQVANQWFHLPWLFLSCCVGSPLGQRVSLSSGLWTDGGSPGVLSCRSGEDFPDEVALRCAVGLAVIGMPHREDAFESGVVRGQSWVCAQGIAERDLLVPARPSATKMFGGMR